MSHFSLVDVFGHRLLVPLFCKSLFTIWILPLLTTPPPWKRWGGGYRNRERDIVSVCTVYHLFSCWYCLSLLRSVWLPVWLILTGATGAMAATVAVMVEDMGAMVDMAAATAVTEVMVAIVVVIMAERHPDMLLNIATVPKSRLCTAWGFAAEDAQHMELSTQWTPRNDIITQWKGWWHCQTTPNLIIRWNKFIATWRVFLILST